MIIRGSYKIFWKRVMQINPLNRHHLEEKDTFHIMEFLTQSIGEI